MSTRARLALGVLVLAIVIAAVLRLTVRPETSTPRAEPSPVATTPVAAAPPETPRPTLSNAEASAARAPSLRDATPSAADAATAAQGKKLALASPRETVDTQLRLLAEHDDDAFRKTFLPSVQDDLTDQAVEGCRKRLVGRKVHPDWEMAEESTERGDAGPPHRVLRVSMFGKSMTGFHETPSGEWLADAAWCVPIW